MKKKLVKPISDNSTDPKKRKETDTKKNKKVKLKLSTSKTKSKIKIIRSTPPKEAPLNGSVLVEDQDLSPDFTLYNKEKLERALTPNLIPIETPPLKITLAKEPQIKKEEENFIWLAIQVEASLSKVWEMWTTPKHIKKWHIVSKEWKVSKIKNDLQVGGEIFISMESPDGEVSELQGAYTAVVSRSMIIFITKENLEVSITLVEVAMRVVKVELKFEPDSFNPVAVQKKGWYTLLENFKKYIDEQISKK